LPELAICELHMDSNVDFMAITRQIIDGFLERGEDVAYFCVVESPHPSPIPETRGRVQADDGHVQGQLDVHCWSTFGQVERKLATLENAGKHYTAIIVDVLSPNPSGCPTPYTEDEGRPHPSYSRVARKPFLRYCRQVIESLGSTMLLLEHDLDVLAEEPGERNWRFSVDEDSLVDARTIILPWDEDPGAHPDCGQITMPMAEVWTSTKYLEKNSNPALLYSDGDGGIDDEMSLGALLFTQGVVKWSEEGFSLPDEAEPVPDLEAVRDWVVANISKAKHLAVNTVK